MKYKYAYQNSGQPILSWKNGPPRQTRAADAASLGSLGGTTLGMPLPAPGAPEPLGDCGCHGGGSSEVILGVKTDFLLGLASAYLFYKLMVRPSGG